MAITRSQTKSGTKTLFRGELPARTRKTKKTAPKKKQKKTSSTIKDTVYGEKKPDHYPICY